MPPKAPKSVPPARRMLIIAVVGQKGGSGKTTIALALAIAAQDEGRAVSLIDLDPQRSAEQWAELRQQLVGSNGLVVVHGTPANLDGMLEAARTTGTDVVVIDTAGHVDKALIYAAAAADLVVVPTRAGILDQFALRDTLDYLKRVGALGRTVAVHNAVGTDETGMAEIERMAQADFAVPMLEVVIANDRDLAASLREGKGVTESAPRRKAAKTIRRLWAELIEMDRRLRQGATR